MGIMAWLKDRIVNLPKLFTAPIVDEEERPIETKTSGERRAAKFLLTLDAWNEHIHDCPLCREQYREDGNPSQRCSTGVVLHKAAQEAYHADL